MADLPSIENLRCFVAGARLLNFRKAARTVALTPAAFGQRIQKLEEELGVTLFLRTTRSVVLTQQGLALLPWAERCLETASECIRAARGDSGPMPMELTLGTRQELGMSWVLPQYDRLLRERPWLQLHLYFGSGPDLMLRVRTLEVDCAITSTRLSDPKLDFFKLHREDYVFVGARALLEDTPLARIEHASRHTLLDTSPARALFRYWADAPGGGDRAEFKSLTCLGSIQAIHDRVLRAAGVAVLPEYLVRADLKSKKLVPILPSVKANHDFFRLVFRVDDPKRAVYESLATSLLEEPLR